MSGFEKELEDPIADLQRTNARAEERRHSESAREAKLRTGDYVERTDLHRNARTVGLWHKPKAEKRRCGAMTRKGTPCQAAAMGGGKGRCRNHGGCSTGPRTPEGIERIRESNRRRAKVTPAISGDAPS